MLDDRFEPRLRTLLQAAAPKAPFPEGAIRDRLRHSIHRRGQESWAPRRPIVHRAVQWVMMVAAAVVIFALGVAYGSWRQEVPVSAGPAAGSALAIQSAGSDWVAQLALFNDSVAVLSPEQRAMIRQVALAALYGAAVELARGMEEDATLTNVAELVAARRASYRDVVAPNTYRF